MRPVMFGNILLCVWTMVGMVFSETQTFGFGDKVRVLLEKSRRALEAAGWDVAVVLSRLDSLRARAWSANEDQEMAKRAQKAKTDAFVALKREFYLAASGYLDMAIAAVGKGTEDGRDLRKYRSRVRRPDSDEAVPLPVAQPVR